MILINSSKKIMHDNNLSQFFVVKKQNLIFFREILQPIFFLFIFGSTLILTVDTRMNQELDLDLPYICCGICFKDYNELKGSTRKLLLTSCAHITCDNHVKSRMLTVRQTSAGLDKQVY